MEVDDALEELYNLTRCRCLKSSGVSAKHEARCLNRHEGAVKIVHRELENLRAEVWQP